ncbi:MAG: D-2-hydroxyacid dehydrogenase [Muribaculaceae bacterium]|nr:D-2-hydroxyacid dehydrogenase [Muribaculaceae bacterium]
MKVVVLDGYPGNPGDLSWDELEAMGECDVYERCAPDLVVPRCQDADAVLVNKVAITRDIIAQLPRLKYLGEMGTGYNNIDVEAAHERGIVVTNVPAYSTWSVAQMTMAHLLNIACRTGHYTRQVRAGRWSDSKDFCYTSTPLIELTGKQMGIVGMGQIGQAVSGMAQALGMKVMAFTSKSQDQLPAGVTIARDLDHLFSTSDVVSLHCPLTRDNAGMVDARRLALMKPTAILLNTARGMLVDEVALAQALNEGKIMAAGIDVMIQEPPAHDNPLLSARNCFFTPHVGWASREARERMMRVIIDNVAAWMAGSPVNVV